MKLIFTLFSALTCALIFPAPAHAYVTYHRLGYVSCNACHTLTTGSGILTTYGRSIQETIAAFAPSESNPIDKPWAVGLQSRALLTGSATGRTSQANPFLMQAEVLAHAARGRWSADTMVGLHLQRGASGEFASVLGAGNQFWVRRALLTARLGAEADASTHSLQFGRDLAISGLLIDDHTAYLRTRNKRTLVDYPTQVRYIYQGERLQWMPYVSAPSFEERAPNQEYGIGSRAEWSLEIEDRPGNSVGATAYFGDTPTLSRTVASLFTRLSFAHWNGLVAEAIVTYRKVHAAGAIGAGGFDQQNLYIKPFVAPWDWLETGVVLETHRVGHPFTENLWRTGPTINLRLHEFVSLLADSRSTVRQSQSTWSWYGQVFAHVQF